MSNKFIDVHSFDGKLKGLFTPLKTYTIEEKKHHFEQLIPLLTNPDAIATVKTMITDLSKESSQNIQLENGIDSSDLLIELIQWKDNNDLLAGLNEQLADAKNLGICPSGRVTRLFQLWNAFKNNDKT